MTPRLQRLATGFSILIAVFACLLMAHSITAGVAAVSTGEIALDGGMK